MKIHLALQHLTFYAIILSFFSIATTVHSEGFIDTLNKSNTKHHRDLTTRDLSTLLTNFKEGRRIVIDIETSVTYKKCPNNKKPCVKYDLLSIKNKDDRDWRLIYEIEYNDYSKEWKAAKKAGLRTADFQYETMNVPYDDGTNVPRYNIVSSVTALFIENKEKYKWTSFSRLTSQAFTEKYIKHVEKGDMTLVDYEYYKVPYEGVFIAAIFIKDKKKRKTFFSAYTKDTWLSAGLDMLKRGNCPLFINNAGNKYAISWIQDASCEPKVFTELTKSAENKKNSKLESQGYRRVDISKRQNDLYGVIWRKEKPTPTRSNPK